jgi:hypothetical protein
MPLKSKLIVAAIIILYPLWGIYMFLADYFYHESLIHGVLKLIMPLLVYITYLIYKDKFGDHEIFKQAANYLLLNTYLFVGVGGYSLFYITEDSPRGAIIGRNVLFVLFGLVMLFFYIMLAINAVKYYRNPVKEET